MFYVLSNSFDPFFNLATEEYLLKNMKEDIFMLWRSEPAVIVGKHQNALAEINYPFLREHKITLARRLSGGGTVVHDLLNLNFTFIANGETGKLIDFKRFVFPIINYLETLNIKAYMGKTNDIRIGDLKISGNAEHVFKNRTLHHGTLLFNSDLDQLSQAIKVSPGKYIDKAVQSNRSSVTNIISHLDTKKTIDEFSFELLEFIKKTLNAELYQLCQADIDSINKLTTEKYKTQEWVWGYSPKYIFQNRFLFENKKWEVNLQIEKGIIIASEISINNETIKNAAIHGVWHRFEELKLYFMRNKFQSLTEPQITELANNFF